MAAKDLNLGDIQLDPEVWAKYQGILSNDAQMPPPETTVHPIVQFAQNLLRPLAQNAAYGIANAAGNADLPSFAPGADLLNLTNPTQPDRLTNFPVLGGLKSQIQYGGATGSEAPLQRTTRSRRSALRRFSRATAPSSTRPDRPSDSSQDARRQRRPRRLRKPRGQPLQRSRIRTASSSRPARPARSSATP
jgi:hypothetical protein